jgi:hypothetical protein
VAGNFDNCYVVNHFEKELSQFRDIFDSMEITQFINRRGTVRMSKQTYEDFGITELQYNMPQFINGWWRKQRIPHMQTLQADKKTKKRWREYCDDYGLVLLWLPDDVLFWNEWFAIRHVENYPGEYMWKHPNTGIQACIVAAETKGSEEIYVVGLDFYQDDYLHRRDVCLPLTRQRAKMKRTRMIEHFEDVLDHYKDIQWHIVTNYKSLRHGDHVELL